MSRTFVGPFVRRSSASCKRVAFFSPDALTPHRRRTRRATDEDEDEIKVDFSAFSRYVGGGGSAPRFGPDSVHVVASVHRNREKCYVCHKAVPLRDYGRHTELCIQQQAAKPVSPSSTSTSACRSRVDL